jgi:DNA modification methylase
VTPVAYLESSVIYCDDNLQRLSQFPAESIDLIYLDPPFFSNRNYEVIWGDEAEVRSFEDRWQGGITVYVEWMRERMIELHRILKRTGSLYLHCDPTASHYLKVMVDEVFGRENFRSDIRWQRTNVHSDSQGWSAVSDDILCYVKSVRAPYVWNPIRVAHSAEYLESKYRYIDPGGRRYRLDNMTSPNPRPNMMYEWKGHKSPAMGWRYEQATMERLDLEGRIWYPDSKEKRPQLKRYLDEMTGVLLGDVWTDIPPINSQARERLGYPTQKPVALLERIITASSNKGQIVLDPFCGCGTTLVAAQKTGREWIGIDISPTAVNIMKERLERVGASDVKLVGMPVTEDQVRALKPFEFQNWVVMSLHGSHAPRKVGDMGVDGYSFMLHEPIQVKQSSGVSRPVVDGFQTAIERSGKKKGYIVAFSFTRGAYEEAARVKSTKALDIVLIRVSDLLERRDLVTPDPGLLMPELPITEARPPDARPSVDELIASDKNGQPASPALG